MGVVVRFAVLGLGVVGGFRFGFDFLICNGRGLNMRVSGGIALRCVGVRATGGVNLAVGVGVGGRQECFSVACLIDELVS